MAAESGTFSSFTAPISALMSGNNTNPDTGLDTGLEMDKFPEPDLVDIVDRVDCRLEMDIGDGGAGRLLIGLMELTGLGLGFWGCNAASAAASVD